MIISIFWWWENFYTHPTCSNPPFISFSVGNFQSTLLSPTPRLFGTQEGESLLSYFLQYLSDATRALLAFIIKAKSMVLTKLLGTAPRNPPLPISPNSTHSLQLGVGIASILQEKFQFAFTDRVSLRYRTGLCCGQTIGNTKVRLYAIGSARFSRLRAQVNIHFWNAIKII